MEFILFFYPTIPVMSNRKTSCVETTVHLAIQIGNGTLTSASCLF